MAVQRKLKGIKFKIPLLFLVVLLALTGCATLESKKETSALSNGPAAQPVQKTMYLDFGDVLFPNQLSLERDDSFIFTTSGLTAGLLSLSGRADVNSLITFFENKMPEDGWQMISEIKAARSMLLFKKKDRWCVISIREGRLKTGVEVWVAPTMAMETTDLQK